MLTSRLLDLAALSATDIPAAAMRMARLSLFDWMVCGLAGRDEPVARILRGMVRAEGGAPQASLIGGGSAPMRSAALVNGATSHALDYDDTHFAHVGHPSVAIYPAALAVAECQDLTVDRVVEAFAIGAEVSIRLGLALGAGHYDRGFHQTATAGAFGATVAAGRLLGLDRDGMRRALGLCATRASGLKSQFGTMGKPYNAGIAASNGVECALLALRGLSAPDDGLAGPQGFLATHAEGSEPEAAFAVPLPQFLLADIRHKLHACCHGTHAMIEGLRAVLADNRVGPDAVAGIHLETAPRWLSVCALAHPRTGLEVKFSYAWLAAMVIHGRDTASDRSFTDAVAADPALMALAAKVVVAGDPGLSDMQARGVVRLAGGRELAFAHDLAAPLPPAALAAELQAKARALLGPVADGLSSQMQATDRLAARDLGRWLETEGKA